MESPRRLRTCAYQTSERAIAILFAGIVAIFAGGGCNLVAIYICVLSGVFVPFQTLEFE